MTPPDFARRVVGWVAPADIRDALIDDLDEAFARRAAATSPGRARRWYLRQAVRGLPSLVRMRLRSRHVPSLPPERSMTMFEFVTQDVRYAARLLRKAPGFTAPAVITLALGIGATSAIFSVVHALLLTPLPYASPDRIVTVWQDMRARGGPADEWATPGNLADWRAETSTFASLASIRLLGSLTLTGMGEPTPLMGEQVTLDYFDVLGVQPLRGRTFRPDDAVPNAPRVVMISHGAWQRRFGGDEGVIGRRIVLGGEPHEIVGVLPDGFRPVVAPATAEVWRPERFNLVNPSRGAVVLRVVARLQPDVSLARARAAMATLATTLEERHPDFNRDVGITVVPLHDRVVSDVRGGLLVLSGAVLFVLLIASVNVANLLLARGSIRTRELAVRMALGATRHRVVRQLLTESLLLASIGGLLGVGVSVLGVRALVAFAPEGLPRLAEVGVNGSVLLFAAVVTIATGLLFGLAPALQGSREDTTPALKATGAGGRGGATGLGQRARRVLIVGEVAVALVLLVGGGLLLRTFLSLQRSDLGFDPSNVLAGFVLPPAAKYPSPESRIAFYDQVLARAEALPGVETAALTSILPLVGGDSDMDFQVEGAAPRKPGEDPPVTWYRVVSAGYFKAMGITPTSGRVFAAREPVPEVVVNEALARKHWPGQDPIGRRLRVGGDDAPWFTVVGTVGDVKHQGPRAAARGQLFIPYWHFPEPGVNVVLKTTGAPAPLARPLTEAVAQVDPDVAVTRPTPMTQAVAASIAAPRFLASLVMLFGGLAAVLAAVGIFGVMSYAVSQRTSEIGVRLALGAGHGQVVWLVLGDGLRLAVLGVAIGLGASLFLTPTLDTMLFGVSAGDPLTFAITAIGLLAVATIACFIPARRATKVTPVTALRE
jgi:putative ABC transport system permease protein